MATGSTSNTQPTIDRNRVVIDSDKIRRECDQFRILVIGNANAGKTTILRKVCNASPDVEPIVYDAGGKLMVRWLDISLFVLLFKQVISESYIEHKTCEGLAGYFQIL